MKRVTIIIPSNTICEEMSKFGTVRSGLNYGNAFIGVQRKALALADAPEFVVGQAFHSQSRREHLVRLSLNWNINGNNKQSWKGWSHQASKESKQIPDVKLSVTKCSYQYLKYLRGRKVGNFIKKFWGLTKADIMKKLLLNKWNQYLQSLNIIKYIINWCVCI